MKIDRWSLGCQTLWAVSILALVALAGCGDDSTTTPPDEVAAPSGVAAVNGDETVTFTWTASPDADRVDFLRYTIYKAEQSLAGIDPAQLATYKVANVGAGFTTYSVAVTNGVRYYFHVRAELNDGTLSVASNEVQAAGRDEGNDSIIEEFAAPGNSGFDFSTGLSVSLSQQNANRFDLTDVYLGTAHLDDLAEFALNLKSPNRLANRDATWATKIAGIKEIASWETTTTTDSGWQEAIEIPAQAGTVYAIKTPAGNYAKIEVVSIDGEPGSRTLTFRYAHQPTVGLALF